MPPQCQFLTALVEIPDLYRAVVTTCGQLGVCWGEAGREGKEMGRVIQRAGIYKIVCFWRILSNGKGVNCRTFQRLNVFIGYKMSLN